MFAVANFADEDLSFDTMADSEIAMSGREVCDRVRQIRQGWTLQERLTRRREAERRFAELLESLVETPHAA